MFICHVGWQVTSDVVHRLMDGIDPEIIHQAEEAAATVPGVVHAHARARWTGRTSASRSRAGSAPDLTTRHADNLGRRVAAAVEQAIPGTGSFTWTARAA